MNKAIDDYTKVIELHPDMAEAYYNRGFPYYKLEQYDKALKDWDKAIEIDPNNLDAIDNRKRLIQAHPELKP